VPSYDAYMIRAGSGFIISPRKIRRPKPQTCREASSEALRIFAQTSTPMVSSLTSVSPTSPDLDEHLMDTPLHL
jgi:hypothetical protein